MAALVSKRFFAIVIEHFSLIIKQTIAPTDNYGMAIKTKGDSGDIHKGPVSKDLLLGPLPSIGSLLAYRPLVTINSTACMNAGHVSCVHADIHINLP